MAINVKEIEQSRSESGVLYLKAQEAEGKKSYLLKRKSGMLRRKGEMRRSLMR